MYFLVKVNLGKWDKIQQYQVTLLYWLIMFSFFAQMLLKAVKKIASTDCWFLMGDVRILVFPHICPDKAEVITNFAVKRLIFIIVF